MKTSSVISDGTKKQNVKTTSKSPPILSEMILYANDCLSDKKYSEYEDYISCKKHKWACRRFLRDVERSKSTSCSFYWDEEEAAKIIAWFGYLRHSKGVLAGKPIELTKWQKFILCQLYGWRMKSTGCKRFHKLFCEVGRKNAKSQMIAGVILYEMSVSSTKNGEIYECYTTGVKRDQSKVIFDECHNLLSGSPLRSRFHLTKSIIQHRKTGSFLKTLSKEDRKSGDGSNPAVLSIDRVFVDVKQGCIGEA